MKQSVQPKPPVSFAMVAISETTGKTLLPIDVARFFFDMSVPWSGKIAMLLATVGPLIYTLFPFDFLPDFIPVIGQVDDLAAWYALAYGFVKWARQFTSRRTLPELLRGEKEGE